MSAQIMDRQKTIQWVLSNLQESAGTKLYSAEIFEKYVDHCKSQSIKPYQMKGLGSIIKKVFPHVVLLKIAHPEGRKWGYKGIAIVDKENQSCMPCTEENIHHHAIQNQFYQVGNIYIQFVGDLIDGVRVTKEIYCDDKGLQLKIHGKTISLSKLNNMPYSTNTTNIHYVLRIISELKLCKGAPAEMMNDKKSMDSKLVAYESNGNLEKRVLSSLCKGHISEMTRNKICEECSKMLKGTETDLPADRPKVPKLAFLDDHTYCRALEDEEPDGDPCQALAANFDEGIPEPLSSNEYDESGIFEVSDDDEQKDPDFSLDDSSPKTQTVTSQAVDQAIDLLVETCPSLDNLESFKMFLKTQIMNSSKSNKRQHRWDPSFIQECIGVWARSPKAYSQLRSSGLFLLPSERTLCLYKNSIDQSKVGIQKSNIEWMLAEAARCKVPPHGFSGGLMFDEVSIQEDLQFYSKKADTKLLGFVDLGKEAKTLHDMRHDGVKMASHVIQFFFLGDTGFKWPVAHFATQECVASELYVMFWEIVGVLMENGFTVNYCSMDGSSNNRAFLKLHFDGVDPSEAQYTTVNPHDPSKELVFIMDPSHEIKKLRNSFLKSGEGGKKLSTKGKDSIQWKHWQAAFNWDKENHSLSLNHRLTREHFYIDQVAKMRNKLAFEVLDKEMLNLMTVYQESTKRTDLNATLELLNHTSVLIKNFTDERPIRSTDDPRLQENKTALAFFKTWHAEGVDYRKNFITRECYEDLLSMILGLEKLVQLKLQHFPFGYIVAKRVNTDVVENFFSSQRGINGSNNNPTFLQYSKGINTIQLSSRIVSTKSNAGGKVASCGALPYKMHANVTSAEWWASDFI